MIFKISVPSSIFNFNQRKHAVPREKDSGMPKTQMCANTCWAICLKALSTLRNVPKGLQVTQSDLRSLSVRSNLWFGCNIVFLI